MSINYLFFLNVYIFNNYFEKLTERSWPMRFYLSKEQSIGGREVRLPCYNE